MNTEQIERKEQVAQTEQAEEMHPSEKTEPFVQTEQSEDVRREQNKKQKHAFDKTTLKRVYSLLTKVLDGVDIDFADRSRLRKTLIAMYKLKAPICILLAVVIALSACYFLFKSDSTATTEMSLNYEESANGLNPNSTRFNVYDIANREVVSGMLTYCGIDPESVDLNSVIDCISIRPTNTKAFSEENFYISTSYRITMKKPPLIKGVGVDELLTFLCKAYKDHLYSNYTENRSILEFDIDAFHDEEFMEIADLLDLKAQQVEKYLNTRAKQNKTFAEKESDESFKSLVQKVEDLRDYDIANYRAFVIQTGTSHDKARYIRALSYVNRIKRLSYDKDMAAYDVRNDGIKLYNEAMISVVMIPSIDESKNTYYMSKTKTGMDYMAAQADDYLLTAQETAKEIETNQSIMVKMRDGTNEPADIKKAKEMIEDIRLKFSDLSKQIETVDKAFIKYKTKDYLTFKTAKPSLTQKLRLSTLCAIAAALLLGLFAAIWLRYRYFIGGKKSEGVSTAAVPFQG